MSDYLPADLVTNILLRLPVVAILRCRSVCKLWLALIDSPRFVNLQIDYSAKNAFLFILEDDFDRNGDLLSAAYTNGLRRENRIHVRTLSPAQIGCTVPRQGITLIGSCNGLLCFGCDTTGNVLIINPATRKSNTVKKHSGIIWPFSTYRGGCGFGYDSVSDDYKIVKIGEKIVSYGVRLKSSVSVHFPYYLTDFQFLGVFACGAIHWVVDRQYETVSNVVVGFDLGLSECKEIPQPKYTNRGCGELILRVGELGKCLCIFANHCGEAVDVWMMKQYGVKESWSVMFSVPHPGLRYEFMIRSLGFSMTGQEVLLLLDDSKLIWYDLKKPAARKVLVDGLTTVCMDAVVCFGSLVRPCPPEGVKKAVKQQPKARNQRKKKVWKL